LSRPFRASDSRAPYPPFFWSLGDKNLLEAGIRFADAREIRWTFEEEGRILGETTNGYEFDVDPVRPRYDFSCSCGASSRRSGINPCAHVVAGLLEWWRQKHGDVKRGAHRTASSSARALEPRETSGNDASTLDAARSDASPIALKPAEVDPAAGAIATFALLGPGLSQVRLWSDPKDPLALTLELFDSEGRTTAKINPDRSLVMPILTALPQMLGSSVRWVGKTAPARVSSQSAKRVFRAGFDDKGRVVVEKAVRLPREGRKKKTLFSEQELDGHLTDGAVFHDGVLYPVEENHLPSLSEVVGLPPGEVGEGPQIIDRDRLAPFLRDLAPRLRENGVLEGDPEILRATVGEPPRLERVTIELASDEFLLRPTFSAGEIELAVEDIAAAARGDGWIHKGSRWIRIEGDPLAELGLGGAKVDENGYLRLTRWNYLRMRALLPDDAAVARTNAADVFEKAITRYTPPEEKPVPAGYLGTLRAYQKEGHDWLLFLRANGLPAILADEMGLGKTHQLICYLLTLRGETERAAPPAPRPSLVVCPRSVLDHWLDKINEFAPSLAPLVHFGPTRSDLAEASARVPVVLTTYGLLVRDQEKFASIEWESVVLDEAQRIKNVSTETSRAARSLKAAHRVASTGTPLENQLEELRSIFEFLAPGFLGSEEEFKNRFVRTIRAGDMAALVRLRSIVHPFKLRRLKRDLLKDLPEKVDDMRHTALSPHQEVLYRQTLDQQARPLVRDLLDQGKRVDYLHVFAVLTRLKRICNHPFLVLGTDKSKELESGKFDLFREVLEEAIEGGQKVVVFSQYLEMLDLIGEHLRNQAIPFVELRGKTTKRGEAVQKFQTDPDCRVFLGSLLAGGVGIDLTAASVVIHYDRWWNAAREDQATDRVHRIGQTRGVQVVNLVTRGTLEESIDRMIAEKRKLLEAIVEPDATSFKNFSRDELISLLGG